MNTPETSPLQAGVAAIRDQIQTLAGRRTGRAGKPVTVRRVGGRGSSWRITASLSGTAARRSVSFTRREVKLGADRIVLSEPGLEIIAAGLEDDTFTLLIAEAQETLAGAHETLDDAMETLYGGAKKGLSFQRYKGLGEMNAEQLWETTMDPQRRRLLQVRIEDDVEADGIFTILMGDLVEPRRQFIEQNALNVKNLDV